MLGLLSPRIIDSISKYYHKIEIRKALFNEFDELRYTLAFVIYDLITKIGEADRNSLEWLVTIFSSYNGFDKDDELINKLNELLQMDDSDLNQLLKHKYDPESALTLKKIYVPFFDSHTQSLSMFSSDFQQVAYDIKRRTKMVNQEIEVSYQFNIKTFDSSIHGDNHQRLKDNVLISYKSIAKMSKALIMSINKLMELKR